VFSITLLSRLFPTCSEFARSDEVEVIIDFCTGTAFKRDLSNARALLCAMKKGCDVAIHNARIIEKFYSQIPFENSNHTTVMNAP